MGTRGGCALPMKEIEKYGRNENGLAFLWRKGETRVRVDYYPLFTI